jgi:hydrogenase/urease accessory protein HupE
LHERTARAAALAALLLPGTARAHSPIEGIGDFYGGLLHPLTVPEHLIVLVTLGLLIGQQGAGPTRRGLVAFASGLLAGILLNDPIAGWVGLATPLLAAGLVLGLLSAMAFDLPAPLVVALAAAAGGLLGLDSAHDMLGTPSGMTLLLGSATSAALLVLYLAAITVCLQRHWQKIGVRIVGSWMATSALLVLVLRVAGSGAAG